MKGIAMAESIGERIRQMRLSQGRSLCELARRAGLHRVTMERIEKRKHDTGVIKIIRIANALRVPLDHLVETVENRNEEPKDRPESKRERILGKPWL